mmetsp:Transcript_3188/g.5620  ORF Transcript_3188/g.5620 Transcript_3188/m.5620 type:complete len:130 (-) Transcript_3188:345-734(-)
MLWWCRQVLGLVLPRIGSKEQCSYLWKESKVPALSGRDLKVKMWMQLLYFVERMIDLELISKYTHDLMEQSIFAELEAVITLALKILKQEPSWKIAMRKTREQKPPKALSNKCHLFIENMENWSECRHV